MTSARLVATRSPPPSSTRWSHPFNLFGAAFPVGAEAPRDHDAAGHHPAGAACSAAPARACGEERRYVSACVVDRRHRGWYRIVTRALDRHHPTAALAG